MSKLRKWEPAAKAKIVLEGLKGRPVAEICNEHQISQSQYYQWKDQFLSNMDKIYTLPRVNQRELHLKDENRRLKTLIGELTVELKKTEELL